VNGVAHADGSQWSDGCNECKCHSGKATCEAKTCDCSAASLHDGCCPQCEAVVASKQQQPQQKCLHLENSGTVKEYAAGQKWLSQCQECECLVSFTLKVFESVSFFLGGKKCSDLYFPHC
jgi:hypothetical protein